jgi:hypothetical protein
MPSEAKGTPNRAGWWGRMPLVMLCEACGERFKAIGTDGLLPHVIAAHPKTPIAHIAQWVMGEARAGTDGTPSPAPGRDEGPEAGL